MSEATSETPWGTRPYSVKRDGVTITNCDSEPVQTPGCIQAHGVLLALRLVDRTILQVSENCGALLGVTPTNLLGKSISEVLGAAGEARLAEVLTKEPIERNPLYFMTIPAVGEARALDASVHMVDGVAIIELEPTGRDALVPPPDYYAILKTSAARLQSAASLSDFYAIVASEVRSMTRLDRVMVYKFHEDGHGEVVGESRREDLQTWVGLHYPAEDIPRPAREIFKQVWIRPVPDALAELAELVPLTNPDTGAALTMTHCTLRGPSVMYTEYLQNMGVRATLTMPIRREGQLWGLIACHHHSPAFLPYQVRAASEFFAQVVSIQYAAAEAREFLLTRLRLESIHNQLVASASRDGRLAAMTEGAPNLLEGMEASGAALHHQGVWSCVGVTPPTKDLERLDEWLSTREELASPKHVYATDSLARDWPEGAALAATVTGLLAVSLSREPRSVMLWFRPETIQTLHWGGDPHVKPTKIGPNGPRLTPRRSFELFAESVRGRSLPWQSVELEAVLRLRLLVLELVVGRADKLARLNADLKRSNDELDAFAYVASHDLKEPLRGIHRYAYQLLEDASQLDAEHRQKVEGLMRLTTRMDSLLDSLLHFSRMGQTELAFHPTDLNQVLEEALEMVEARRDEQNTKIVVPRSLPVHRCDRTGVREIFSNLLSNAIKYSDKPQRLIEVGFVAAKDEADRASWPPGARSHTVFYVRDNGIGIAAKHQGQVFRVFKRLHARDAYGGGVGAGLSIAQKLVERHSGRIWFESTVGVGTTFFFTLPSETEGAQ